LEARLTGEEYPDHYRIGGSPCSGKSTIADRLAATYGMQVYRCDDAFFRHQMSIDP
jgi:cytidylate kinase